MVYDHDTLRLAAAWTGQGFIDWNGINFNGRHQVHPRIVGKVHVANPTAPAGRTRTTRASPTPASEGATADPTVPCRASWAHYKGLYHHGDQVILAYTVGTADDSRNARASRPTRRTRIIADLHPHPGDRPIARTT